jgi:hypothetical protein
MKCLLGLGRQLSAASEVVLLKQSLELLLQRLVYDGTRQVVPGGQSLCHLDVAELSGDVLDDVVFIQRHRQHLAALVDKRDAAGGLVGSGNENRPRTDLVGNK